MYERILVPTDGSEYAIDAADRAFELATALDASVHVLCVAETGPLGSVRLPGEGGSAADVLGERAQTYVDELVERGDERGVSVTGAVRRGIPVREILEHVEETDADLIVMGTRGRGGLGRMMLGSVTDGVTRYGAVDVLAVSHEGEESRPDRV